MKGIDKHIDEIGSIRKMLNVFIHYKQLTETQIYKLVEERGVWPAPYKQGIEKVVKKYIGLSCHT